MTKTAKTLREARTYITERLNVKDSTAYEDVVVRILNDAAADVSAQHDWEYLRKRDTLTFGAATPKVSLPTDCDRVLAIMKSGANYMLTKVDPLDFEREVNNDSNVEPKFWCVDGYDQSVATSAPFVNIRVHTAPSNGDEYTIWYIKHIDEMVGDSTDLDNVPNIPLPLWNVIIAKAIYEGLLLRGAPNVKIQNAERHFANLLMQAKRRERYGSSNYDTINQRADVLNHLYSRMR